MLNHQSIIYKDCYLQKITKYDIIDIVIRGDYMSKMNLPNKLTIFRMLLIPVIMIVYAIKPLNSQQVFNEFDGFTVANLIILILIIIGSLTDFLDGKIARKYNLVTNFGKFLDPIADKLLVITGFVILMDQSNKAGNGLFTWWMLAIILAREFIVSGMRLIAVENGRVIAASKYGKIKTTIQFITLIYLFIGIGTTKVNAYTIIGLLFVYATLVATVFSGIDYLVKNREVLNDSGQKGTKKRKK